MRGRSKLKAFAASFMLLAGAFLVGTTPASATPMDDLRQSFDHGHWIAYAATNADPNKGKIADENSVRADLTVLKNRGFNGICTYGCDNFMTENTIPKLCDELNIKLVVGVWDPNSTTQLETAVKVANQRPCVLGICVGNEGGCERELNGKDRRYTFDQSAAAVNYCKARTAKPVTTCEQFEKYTNNTLLNTGDFLMPNIHPYWNKIVDAQRGVDFTMQKYLGIKNSTSKPVMCKEVGYPTEGDGNVSQKLQADYYKLLATKPIQFMYFEAFDGTWKGKEHAVEPSWGLWTFDRKPKQIVAELPW